MNVSNLNVTTNQNPTFQAKLPKKALNMTCKPIGEIIEKSAKELKIQLTKLKDKKMELETFVEKNPNNLEAKIQLDSIKSAILEVRADLMSVLKK